MQNMQTLYTRNLEKAKEFFEGQLKEKNVDEIESIFDKLTQKL